MLDKLNSNKPERRSAIKSKGLQKYNINIAAQSDMKERGRAKYSTGAVKLQIEINLQWCSGFCS